MSDGKCSVLTAVQGLLQASDDPGGGVSKQVYMAIALLTQSPGLSNVALSVLTSAYQCYLTQPDKAGSVEKGLAVALEQAEEVILLLLDHAPHTWSLRILQWCVDVATSASRLSGGHVTAVGLPPEASVQQWLQHPKLLVIITFLDKSIRYLASSDRERECVEVVLRECLNHAPKLNWLLTHVLSQQPAELLLPFLEQVLQLPISHLSPFFTGIGQTLEFLGHSCKDVVGQCMLQVVQRVVSGEGGQREEWGRRVELLLRLAPLCEGLLSFISRDCLQLVTADKMKVVVTAASNTRDDSQDGHMSSEEDEGEVKSDEEATAESEIVEARDSHSRSRGVQDAVVEVLRVLDKEDAAQAITQLVQTFSCLSDLAQSQEDAMEEGEIVHVSLVNVVQEGCWGILTKLLQQLHVAAMGHLTLGPRGARGSGSEGHFAVGLQCGLQQWSLMILQPDLDARCQEWLCSALSSVCVCAAELQAAQALASMLLHCHHEEHLGKVLKVYEEVSVRYSQLAQSTVQAGLALCQEGEPASWFSVNLWRIIVNKAINVNQQTRSNFSVAVSGNMLAFSSLLCSQAEDQWVGEECGVWRLLEVMGEGLGERGSDYSTHCQVLTNLLSFYFSCLTGTTHHLASNGVDIKRELCLGKCATLLARWVGPCGSHSNRESLQMFFLTSLLRRTLSQDVSGYIGTVSQVVGGWKQSKDRQLLNSNQTLALGVSHTPSGMSGSLQHICRPIRSHSKELYMTFTSHCTNHILSLLEMVISGKGDLVVSVLLDQVAPHLPSDSSPWLPGDGPRSTSLEWSLSVKQQFDRHPFLWDLLHFAAYCGCSFSQCEPLVCALLLVLTQHWFSCRCSSGLVSGKELLNTERLVDSLAEAGWLPPPLCFSAELFQSVTSHDLYLILSAISNFIKANLQELRRGALTQLKGTGYEEVVRGVLVRNIHRLGHLYAHYVT